MDLGEPLKLVRQKGALLALDGSPIKNDFHDMADYLERWLRGQPVSRRLVFAFRDKSYVTCTSAASSDNGGGLSFSSASREFQEPLSLQFSSLIRAFRSSWGEDGLVWARALEGDQEIATCSTIEALGEAIRLQKQ